MITRQISVFPEMAQFEARSRRLLVTAVACAGLAGCGQSSSSEGVPHEPEVLRGIVTDAATVGNLLQECDAAKLKVVLQDVLGLPTSAEVLGLLDDVWTNGNGEPAMAACIRREVVRVYVANALAQAHSNRMFEVAQMPSVLEALRGALSSRSSEVVQIAMMGLGDFLTADDAVRLGQIADGPNPANAKVAVSTLALSCTPAAGNEITRLAAGEGVLSPGDVTVIRERMQEARRIKCDPPKD